MNQFMTSLFDPITLGAIEAPNRIMMAPLTRGRATRSHVPTPLMGEYYSQRASAGLIISEATGISQQGLGWPNAPGLWSEEQVTGWRPVVRAVHDAGGRIIAQLWHMGRLVHPDYLGGAQPVSASATTAPGHAHTYEGNKLYAESRALERQEIRKVIDDYRRAAEHAMAAGFDGVELHAANGYLIDQFLRDGTNRRGDSYGGPVENRIRLLTEVTRVLISVAGVDRTGVRLSPNDSSRSLERAADSFLGNARFTSRKHFPACNPATRPGHSAGVQRHADFEFRLFPRRCVASPAPGRGRCNRIWSALSGKS
jgi:N-ethylmaleimide reductase